MLLTSLLKIKTKSHRIVLNAIREHREISGAELSRLTKYRRSTLVYILRSLKSEGLIEISRIGESTAVGGKPPTLWRLVPDKGYVIGLEILPDNIRTTIINFSSDVNYQQIDRFDLDLKNGENISVLSDFILEKINRLNIPKEKVIGVGIALPGLVDRIKGIVHFSRSMNLNNCPLLELLEKELDIPVRICNDANAGSLGIKWFHRKSLKLPSNIVFMTINESSCGIGAGLILNNKLYDGASGTAGEIFTPLPEINHLYDEGLEQFESTKIKLQKPPNDRKITVAEVAECYKKNCKLSNYILSNITDVVAQEIITIIQLLNPALIVIGGDFCGAKFASIDYITPVVEKKCKEIFPTGILIPKIAFSEFDVYSVSIGTTALILEEIFSY